MKSESLARIRIAQQKRAALLRATWIESGKEAFFVLDEGDARTEEERLDRVRDPDFKSALARAAAHDEGQLIDSESGPVFVHPFNPSRRLVIIGAVQIAQHLSNIAHDLDYEVWLIDPRSGFLTPARFPTARRMQSWPTDALASLDLDRRTAFVTLSHDPKIDNPALEIALRSTCFYVGALGSRRTQAKRRERLLEAGLSEDEVDRIKGPVGLDLGARGPAEIALSIAAEMTSCLRRD